MNGFESAPATATAPAPASRLDRFVASYRDEHQHPVNHFLHVAVGWPLCAAAVLVLPWRPLWFVGLFLGGYALMFLGHFVFERNIPTIFKYPATPFVIAWAVIRGFCTGVVRLATPNRGR
jgi:hypothetical protein